MLSILPRRAFLYRHIVIPNVLIYNVAGFIFMLALLLIKLPQCDSCSQLRATIIFDCLSELYTGHLILYEVFIVALYKYIAYYNVYLNCVL